MGDRNAVLTSADDYAGVITSSTLTRLANATAYASGQLVANSTTAASVVPLTWADAVRFSDGRSVRIDRARLFKSSANALGSFRLWLFRAAPTLAVGDTGTLAGGVTVADLVGRFDFDMTTGALGSDGCAAAGIPMIGPAVLTTLPAGSSTLYGLIEARGAYTPGSAETFSIRLETYRF